jgi:hypothetical protein
MYGGVLYCGVLRYGKLPLNQSRNKFSVRRLKKLMLTFVSMTVAREADAEPSSA